MKLYEDVAYQARLDRIQAADRLSSAGGKGRAAALSPKERKHIASKAAKARWKNQQASGR